MTGRILRALLALAILWSIPALALTSSQRSVLLGSNRGPSLTFDATAKALPSWLTLTRSGATGTYCDSTGTLQTASANAPRWAYDCNTQAYIGLLLEESRTNYIRNNGTGGATTGTLPTGTMPTNWIQWPAPTNGINTTVTAISTVSGVPTITVRIFGTPTSSFGINALFDSSTQIAAVQNQAFASSLYLALTAGSLTNFGGPNFTIGFFNNVGGLLTAPGCGAITPTATYKRYTCVQSGSNASTAYVNILFNANFTSGQAIDATFQIGMPQIEAGAFTTSAIATASSAVTRSADSLAVTGGSWFNPFAGTLWAKAVKYNSALATTNSELFSVQTDTNNVLTERIAAASTNVGADIFSGGTNVASFTSGTETDGAPFKVAMSYSASAKRVAGALSGGAVTTATNASFPASPSLTIGGAFGRGGNCNCGILGFKYWPRALSGSELTAATR